MDLLIADGPGADEITENNQVRRALCALKGLELQVILLRFWRGLGYDEVGAKLGSSRRHIVQIESAALRKMRWALADPGAYQYPAAEYADLQEKAVDIREEVFA